MTTQPWWAWHSATERMEKWRREPLLVFMATATKTKKKAITRREGALPRWFEWDRAQQALKRWTRDLIGYRSYTSVFKEHPGQPLCYVNFSERKIYIDPSLYKIFTADALDPPQYWGSSVLERPGQVHALLCRAATVHECGHVLFTAGDVRCDNALHQWLWNALEDERMERLVGAWSERAWMDLRELGIRTWLGGFKTGESRDEAFLSAILFSRLMRRRRLRSSCPWMRIPVSGKRWSILSVKKRGKPTMPTRWPTSPATSWRRWGSRQRSHPQPSV